MADTILNTPAPDFTLTNQRGETVTLSQYQGKQPVVVFFYPKDNTPGCTQEVCAFRDNYQVFQEAGAEVIGISNDNESSHQQFAEKHGLPFQILSDPGGQTRAAWRVPKTLGLLPGRVTYIIDADGIIQHMFSSPFNIEGHIQEALSVLKQMS